MEGLQTETKRADPCILVIFGATGDLTSRKLLPALYNLMREGLLPTAFALVGFARRDKTDEQFRAEMRADVEKFSRTKPIDPTIWAAFEKQIFYHHSEFDDPKGYASLKNSLDQIDRQMGTKGNRIFYLSTQPSYFSVVCRHLHQAGLVYLDQPSPWSRVIIEKPFGRDLSSAEALQKEITHYLSEKQIYRIDHYLGKETVQNILIFRFANLLFESLWNNRYINHVQITVAEEIGIGTRGKFWEEAGFVRDIMQNHMMQLLTLIAMEPPAQLDADSIRDEKVKVLEAIRPFKPDEIAKMAVRGQYAPGFVNGEKVVGYREEQNVAPSSSIETYAAAHFSIDNWRWQGVPFYLRGGKRLPKRATEIAVTFKAPPEVLFLQEGQKHDPNVLALRIQPDEGASLKIQCKTPGTTGPIQPVKMDFRYGSYFGGSTPEAYERLICDCMVGDSTLFAREDEVLHSWRLFTPLLERWAEEAPEEFPNYAAGTYGPKEADELLAREGHKWRML